MRDEIQEFMTRYFPLRVFRNNNSMDLFLVYDEISELNKAIDKQIELFERISARASESRGIVDKRIAHLLEAASKHAGKKMILGGEYVEILENGGYKVLDEEPPVQFATDVRVDFS